MGKKNQLLNQITFKRFGLSSNLYIRGKSNLKEKLKKKILGIIL